jgi:hypothetical protein
MKTMNLGSDDAPVTKKKKNSRNLKIALGLAAVVLVPTIGTTLAASITVSSSGSEFGQGVTQIVSCQSNAISIVPASIFLTEGDIGAWYLDWIRVGLIDDTCDGKTFKIKLLDAAGPIELGTEGFSTNYCEIAYSTASSNYVGGSCTVTESELGEFIITPNGDVATDDFAAITIETSN